MAGKKPGNTLKRWLLSLGPGIITAALVFGPSKITITTKLGASFGYDLLWIVFIAIFFMIIFTHMGARIGLASEHSLLVTIRKQWGKTVSVIIGVGLFLVATSFQAGNSIGVGIAIGEATGTSAKIWVLVFNLFGIALLFFRSFYKMLEKLMIALVALMLFSFVTTLFFAHPDPASMAEGFVPSIPAGSQGLIVAFMASCFSIAGAFYQSYLMQEQRKVRRAKGEAVQDSSVTGILILGVMSAVVMICAAAVLKPKGIDVSSASDMSKALQPLFGKYAADLFLVGLFGASFSSLVGNATLGGSLLSDSLGKDSKLSSRTARICIGLVMLCGAGIALRFGRLPLELIVFAQSITIFLVPFIGVSIYLIANKKSVMKERVNSPFERIFGGLGLLVLFLLAIYNANALFF